MLLLRCRSAVAAGLLAVLLSGRAAAGGGAPAPVFELRGLGVLGGDYDGNLSCWLLARAGEPARVMIDGGTVLPGIVRWQERDKKLPLDASWSRRVAAALPVLRPIEALLLTHAHLDHIAGFVEKATLDLVLAKNGRPPLEIIAQASAITAVRGLLGLPLWADFTKLPADNPALRLSPLVPGAPRPVGPFTVEAIALSHPGESAAFLIGVEGASYLHLGDSGPTEAVWTRARAPLAEGQLRAITVDVSYPSREEALARLTGHLTPRLLLVELARLVGLTPLPEAARLDETSTIALARQLAPRLRRTVVVAGHIKAREYDTVVGELRAIERAGVRLIIPEQGAAYRF